MVVVDCWPFTSDDRTRECLQIPDYYRKFRYDTHTRIVNIYKVLSYRICIYDNFPDLRENLRYYNFYDKYYRLRVLGTTLQPQGKESGQRDTTKNHDSLCGIAKHRDIFKSNLAICLKRQVYNSCVLPAMTYGAETWTLTKQVQNKLAAAQTKMERSMLNITYKDRRTNIWVRERTKLIRYNLHCEKNEMVLGRAYQPPQRRPMDLSRHHLETI